MIEFSALGAIGHVLRSTFGNLGFAVRMSWPWMTFVLLLQLVTIFLFPSYQDASAMKPAALLAKPDVLTVLAVLTVCNLFAFSSIAVNWHRYILLDEEPEGWDRLRLDGITMRYLGNALLVQLFAVSIGFVGALLMVMGTAFLSAVMSKVAAGASSAILIAVIIFYCSALITRLSLKLPAVAVEREDYGFGAAWADTTGHTFGIALFLFGLFLLVCLFAVGIAIYAVGYRPFGLSLVGQITFALFQLLGNWFVLVIGVTSLTTLYGVFGEGREL